MDRVGVLHSKNFLLDFFFNSRTGSKPSWGKNDCKLKLALLLAVVVRFLAAKRSDALHRTTSPFWLIFLNIIIFSVILNLFLALFSTFTFGSLFIFLTLFSCVMCVFHFCWLFCRLHASPLSPSQFFVRSLARSLSHFLFFHRRAFWFSKTQQSKLGDVTCFK